MLSSTAKTILDQMDSLFENDIESNTNFGTMMTPPRFSKSNKESLNSPELSLATYRTTSSTITKHDSQEVDSTAPSGMVITAEQKLIFAEEAIMDPTWLDSEEEEEEEENLMSGDKSKSFISISGSLLSGAQSDDSKSRSSSFGSSISVGSCGFGKSSLCDLSISSIGSKHSYENHLLDIIDMGKSNESLKHSDISASGGSGYHELEYLYNLGRSDYDYNNKSIQSCQDQDDGSEDEKSAYLPPHLITQNAMKRNHSIDDDEFETFEGGYYNLDEFSDICLDESSEENESYANTADEDSTINGLDLDLAIEDNVLNKESANTSAQDHDELRQSIDSNLIVKNCPVIKLADADHCYDTLSLHCSPENTEHLSTIDIPSEPLLLLDNEAGICTKDLVFSLFDCLGSKSRKKRSLKSDQSNFRWGHHVFQSCLRKSRYLQSLTFIEKKSEIRCPTKGNDKYILDLLACYKFDEAIHECENNILILNRKIEECDSRQDVCSNYQRCINMTQLNLGIIHLMACDYRNALKALNSTLETFTDDDEIYVRVLNLIACANYALGYFENAYQLWIDALAILKKDNVIDTRMVLAQIYNNIGCSLFEISSESKALMYLNKSVATLQEFTEKDKLLKTTLYIVATTRGNIGYLHLRMKKNTLAINDFELSLNDGNRCLDGKDEFITVTLDYLAIAFLRIGNYNEALKLYSKILTSRIEKHNGAHDECALILNKINLLQHKGKKNKNHTSKKCILNIYNSIEGNQIEQERFKKFLKSIGLYSRRSHNSVK